MIHRWEVLLLNNKPKEKRNIKSIFLRLCGYVLKYWYLFIPAVIFTFVSNHFSLMGPKYSGDAIDALSDGVKFKIVYENVVKMIVCYVLSALISYVLSIIMMFISQKIVYTMRKQMFEKLTSLPVGYFDTHPTGDIISHISYDIDTINSTLSHDLVQIMTSLYMVIGSISFMWNISKPLILIFAITVPVSILFTKYRSKKVRPLFRTRSAKLGQLNGYAEEMLSGCRSIQAYSREEEISRRFNEKNTDSMDAYYKSDYYSCIMGPTVNFINNFSISLVMILGGILYMFSQNGMAQPGTLFFISLGGIAQFVQYSRKFAGPINEFANILHELQSAFSAAERVFNILDEEPELKDKENAELLENVGGEVKFEDVVFGYTPDKTILKNIDFIVEPGKRIAIVGPTGAGKTTIINLLMRFYDVQSGKLSVDGKDCRDYTRASLREAYTMVLQDTWLFKGTIYENIAYGKEGATLDEVIKAAKAAKIHNYIEALPDGYNTVLTDDGINISKGQRQLITIARAMISNSQMLILDEATSNVDSRTEIKIQEAMDELMREKTCFIIAHRLSTIRNADMILVIQDGQITECGNHDELLNKNGFYASLYNSQFI